MPLRDRKVKTIPWYRQSDFPEDIFAAAERSSTTGATPIRVGLSRVDWPSAVAPREQGCECCDGLARSVGRRSSFRRSATRRPRRARASSCSVTIPSTRRRTTPACGRRGAQPAMGDLRYNFFTYVVSRRRRPRGASMVDARTRSPAEKVAGSVKPVGSTLDRAPGSSSTSSSHQRRDAARRFHRPAKDVLPNWGRRKSGQRHRGEAGRDVGHRAHARLAASIRTPWRRSHRRTQDRGQEGWTEVPRGSRPRMDAPRGRRQARTRGTPRHENRLGSSEAPISNRR